MLLANWRHRTRCTTISSKCILKQSKDKNRVRWKSEEESFAGQRRITSLFREEYGKMHSPVEYRTIHCIRELIDSIQLKKKEILSSGAESLKVIACYQCDLSAIVTPEHNFFILLFFIHNILFPPSPQPPLITGSMGKEPFQTGSQESNARSLSSTIPVPYFFPWAVLHSEVVLLSVSSVNRSKGWRGSLWNKSFGIWAIRDAQTAQQTLWYQYFLDQAVIISVLIPSYSF